MSKFEIEIDGFTFTGTTYCDSSGNECIETIFLDGKCCYDLLNTIGDYEKICSSIIIKLIDKYLKSR